MSPPRDFMQLEVPTMEGITTTTDENKPKKKRKLTQTKLPIKKIQKTSMLNSSLASNTGVPHLGKLCGECLDTRHLHRQRSATRTPGGLR